LDGAEKVSKRKAWFSDVEQVLKVFIVCWSMGFVWFFALKWPYSIQSLFLRRCLLCEATFVGIFMKRTDKTAPTDIKMKGGCSAAYEFLSLLFARAFDFIQTFFSLLFSDRDCFHTNPDGTYQICPVKRSYSDDSRYFILTFRRYNFDNEASKFVAGKFEVGETIEDLQNAGSNDVGLAAHDVKHRLRLVGPNSIEVPKPNFFKILTEEFSKAFYTFQLFMVFSCKYCVSGCAEPNTLSSRRVPSFLLLHGPYLVDDNCAYWVDCCILSLPKPLHAAQNHLGAW
jgi:Cation transporter/ATPase, N-terminus